MGVVAYADKDKLTGEALEIYRKAEERSGLVTNMVKTLLNSVPAFRALEFYPVQDALAEKIGKRATYFYCYAISDADACLICTTVHARYLEEMGIKPEEFEFTEEEKALIAYGRAMAKDPANIPDDIYAKMKELFSDEEIVLITAVGCRMVASNMFNLALKVDVDEYLYDVDFDKSILDKAE